MGNKQLRVMILEADFLQRLGIEKMLNDLGYYAVTAMTSGREVFSVLRYATQAFDLVIANGDLVEESGIDFRIGCDLHPLVHHMLIYESAVPVFEPALSYRAQAVQSILSHPPDIRTMRYLMRTIDSEALPPFTAVTPGDN